ncbi:MAG: helix-turn-helix transcriptional regulator [Limisphaerales bacterium]
MPRSKQTEKTASPRNVIGLRIRSIRQKAKPPVTQVDLVGRLAAQGIYLDRTAIARMENNSRFIRDYEIVAIAKCLRVPISSLFSE